MINRVSAPATRPEAQTTSIVRIGLTCEEADDFNVAAADSPHSWPLAAEWLRALVAPLRHRVARGEGGLWVVNAGLALKRYPSAEGLGLAAVSLICLLSLYLFNDIIDARDDQRNPKKDQFVSGLYLRERHSFLVACFLMIGFATVAGSYLDTRAGVWVVGVSLINVAYSLLCKKVPLLDVATVGLWGGAFASIVTDEPAWIVMVGAMTAVCHIYQASEDRDADTGNGIATSATLAAPLLSLVQGGLAVLLATTAWTLGTGAVALTFAAFFAYWLVWRRRPHTAWLLSKVHFSAVLAYLLLRS